MTTKARKEQLRALRAEGYGARMAGRSLQSNPHKHMDAGHWAEGWHSAATMTGAKMSRAEAEKILAGCPEYIDVMVKAPYGEALLDGCFTAQELEAVLTLVRLGAKYNSLEQPVE